MTSRGAHLLLATAVVTGDTPASARSPHMLSERWFTTRGRSPHETRERWVTRREEDVLDAPAEAMPSLSRTAPTPLRRGPQPSLSVIRLIRFP